MDFMQVTLVLIDHLSEFMRQIFLDSATRALLHGLVKTSFAHVTTHQQAAVRRNRPLLGTQSEFIKLKPHYLPCRWSWRTRQRPRTSTGTAPLPFSGATTARACSSRLWQKPWAPKPGESRSTLTRPGKGQLGSLGSLDHLRAVLSRSSVGKVGLTVSVCVG